MRRFCAKNIIIYIIIILLTFLGCTEPDVINVSNTASPAVTTQPFFASDEILAGGDGLNHQNLADIKIESVSNDKVQLTLSFMTGSGISLVDQQVSDGVPNFTISHADGVDRMIVKLDGISNWTYRVYEDEIQNNDIIQGILRKEPIGSDSLYLYISTKDEYAYRVDTTENKIQITFNHIDEDTIYRYYVKINAFVEYQNGYFSSDDFLPCISSDGANGVLLSKPFEGLEEADAFMQEKQAKFADILDEEDMSVIYLGSNELPEYNYENQLEQIINNPIGYKGQDPVVGEALIKEGRFLSWGISSDEYAYVKPYTLLGSQAGDVFSYEEIWVHSIEGDISLVDHQFTSILSASYSYDYKFIAFIDQSDETRMLEIVDTETGNVYVPADDGFGIDTSSFVWSSNDNRLFAITGTHDSKQLLCYDMRDLNDIKVYALTEEEYMESSLYLYDENIYYLKADDESQKTDIYEADIETGNARKLLSGNSFMLASNGKNMIVNDMQYDNAEEYSFYIYNFETREKSEIESGKMIMDYTWSKNDSRVYYTVYKNAGWDEEYPLELYYYDFFEKKSVYVMDMITGALYPAYDDGDVLVMSIFQLQDKQITITYQVD